MAQLLVSQILIYPVKSLGSIEVLSANVLAKGLEFDRRWMLIDENYHSITQRRFPKMALIKLAFSGGNNQISIISNGDSTILPRVESGEVFTSTVWEDEVEVFEPDPGVSRWFSDKLGITCKLVAFPEENQRLVDRDFAANINDQTSLSDGYPVLVIGQSSLDDLNTKLPKPVGMDRFRPNIVFTGGTPFEEESWKKFSIGEVQMWGVKPCSRCVMTTIDQQTGMVSGKEPLATLIQYRRVDNKVLFGQNVIPLTTGEINVGDLITLQ